MRRRSRPSILHKPSGLEGMVQAVLAYLIVALALAWVVWRMFVPGKLKADLIAWLQRKP